MNFVRARVLLGFVVSVTLWIAATPVSADGPAAYNRCMDSMTAETSGDLIDSNVPVLGWKDYYLQLEVSGGPISGASTSVTMPGGLYELYTSTPSTVSWVGSSQTLTFTPLTPLADGRSEIGVTPIRSMDKQTLRVKASRSVSNPIFTSDLETRTVSVTLDIAPGALASDHNLYVGLVPVWMLPSELSPTAVANPIFPAGFSAWFDANTGGEAVAQFSTHDSAGLGSLSGLYTFSADVTFQRSGALRQSAIGNMLFKPPEFLGFGQTESAAPALGTSASITAGPGVQVTFAAGQPVVFSIGAHRAGQELRFSSVVAADGAPASVQQIIVVKGREVTVTGGTAYGFHAVIIESNNVLSATVTTPGGATHELIGDEGRGFYFDVESDVAADLAGFGLGNYTIKVWGADGNAKTYLVPLAGELPTDTPTYNIANWSTIADSRPTISWGASADPNVNKLHIGLYAADKDYVEGLADSNQTSLAPLEDLPDGFADAHVMFIAGQEYTFPDGAKYLSGFYSAADLGFNVVVPEPASLGLLACGAAALFLRRRPGAVVCAAQRSNHVRTS